MVCSVSDNKQNSKKIKQAVEKNDVRIVEKKYSYNELLSLKDLIEQKRLNEKSELLNSIIAIGIDDKNNQVVVEVLNLSANQKEELKSMFGNSNKIMIKNKTEEMQPRTTSLAAVTIVKNEKQVAKMNNLSYDEYVEQIHGISKDEYYDKLYKEMEQQIKVALLIGALANELNVTCEFDENNVENSYSVLYDNVCKELIKEIGDE